MKFSKIKFGQQLQLKKALVLFIFSVQAMVLVYPLNKTAVSNVESLQTAISKAKPGDVITLLKGDYNSEISIEANGVKNNPIVIVADGTGKVTISKKMAVKGNYISIKGLQFVNNGQLEIVGQGHRVTYCTWDDSESGKWLTVLAGSMQVEIDHNVFKNKIKSNTTLDKNCQLLQVLVRNQNESHHIHHNLFKNIAKGKTGNGFETIQLRSEFNSFKFGEANTNNLIEYNLFERCNGESEVVSVKSNGNIIKNNTFRACQGGLVLRHGENSEISSNYFLGEGDPKCAGIRMAGSGHKITNNYLQDLGEYSLAMMDGAPDNFYLHVDSVSVLFNSFINCTNNFVIGLNHERYPEGTTPTNCKIIGNIFYSDKVNNSETFFEFIKNQKPTNWIVENNIAWGKNTNDIKGVVSKEFKLKVNTLNLLEPTENVSKVNLSELHCKPATHDIFGQPYNNEFITVGAIQYPIAKMANKPLSEIENFNYSSKKKKMKK